MLGGKFYHAKTELWEKEFFKQIKFYNIKQKEELNAQSLIIIICQALGGCTSP